MTTTLLIAKLMLTLADVRATLGFRVSLSAEFFAEDRGFNNSEFLRRMCIACGIQEKRSVTHRLQALMRYG
jgi:hypothetical protein